MATMLTRHHLSVGGKKTGKEIKKVCHLLNVIPKNLSFFFLPPRAAGRCSHSSPIEVKPSPSSWCFVAADIDTCLSPLYGVEISACPLRTEENDTITAGARYYSRLHLPSSDLKETGFSAGRGWSTRHCKTSPSLGCKRVDYKNKQWYHPLQS